MRRARAVAAALATLALGAATSVSAQAAGPIEEYGGFTTGASPCEVEFDKTGTLWTELVGANAMGRVNTRTGAVKQFPLPTPGGIPGGMELGPDGNIWFPEVVGNKIVRLTPRNGRMKEYTIPYGSPLGGSQKAKYGYASSDDVTFGRDHALYFTLIGTNGIGRFDIATKKFSKIDIPGLPAGPAIIQPGPGNLLMFGQISRDKVGVIDTSTQKIRQYSVPSPNTQGVTLGPDNKIWYTSPLGQSIGRIDPATGDVKEINLLALRGANIPATPGSPLLTPTTIRTGGDGNLYFGEGGLLFPSFGNKIGRYDPRTNTLEEISTPSPGSTPCDQNAQKPDQLWTGEFTANKVGRLRLQADPKYAYCRQVACPTGVPARPDN